MEVYQSTLSLLRTAKAKATNDFEVYISISRRACYLCRSCFNFNENKSGPSDKGSVRCDVCTRREEILGRISCDATLARGLQDVRDGDGDESGT